MKRKEGWQFGAKSQLSAKLQLSESGTVWPGLSYERLTARRDRSIGGPIVQWKRASRAGLTVVFVLCTLLFVPSEASASPVRNGICDDGEVCFYFNSNQAGSLSDMNYSLADYKSDPSTCNHFIGPGNGKGLCLKNNAASIWNRTGRPVRVYFNSNFGGSSQEFARKAKGNLNAKLKNNNASHKILALFDDPTVDLGGVEDLRAHGGYDGSTAWVEADFGGGRMYRVAVQCDIRYAPDYWAYGAFVERGVSHADCGGGHRAYGGWAEWRFPDGSFRRSYATGL